jgi:cytochrome oxidase Cu insertion factor (SCO1/SenC/PrrC family)
MAHEKMRLVAVAVSVVGLGIVFGTALWLKLGPGPQLSGWRQSPVEGLNRYGAVPEFVLLERSGKSISLTDLQGAIWIVDFIYTACRDTCPMQTAEMAKLQEQLKDDATVRLLSISVDPETDTPKVLSHYADHYKADANRWLFLTGAKEQISRLVEEGFRLSAAPAGDGSGPPGVILHSPRFVLLDRQTQIRGYYDSRDREALKRLRKDIATLLKG